MPARGVVSDLSTAPDDIFMESVRPERPPLISLIRDERARIYDPYKDRARSFGLLAYDEEAFFFWEDQREAAYEFWRT